MYVSTGQIHSEKIQEIDAQVGKSSSKHGKSTDRQPSTNGQETNSIPSLNNSTGQRPPLKNSTGLHPMPRTSTGRRPLPRNSTGLHPQPRNSTGLHPQPRNSTGLQPEPNNSTGQQHQANGQQNNFGGQQELVSKVKPENQDETLPSQKGQEG